MADKNVFETLNAINVNGHTESKNGLTYLSWAWAWAEVKKVYPEANYEIVKQPITGLPYAYDPLTGYMVYTKVTIGDVTHEMWLPVMDGNNRAMKAEPYEIQTKYKTIPVASATMFDINKTIMRCLVKNLAMFGLGLYIYAGEDLPEAEEDTPAPKKTASKKAPAKTFNPTGDIAPNGEPMEAPKTVAETAPKKPSYPNRNEFLKFCKENELDTATVCKELGLTKSSPDVDFISALSYATKLVAMKEQEETGVELPFEI